MSCNARVGSFFLMLAIAATAAPAAARNADALSKVSLTYTIGNATCTLTTPTGTTNIPCDRDGWRVNLQQGWTATMVAPVTYTYVDDGLPLPEGGPGLFNTPGLYLFPVGITGVAFLSGIRPTHESGAIYVSTPFCGRTGCSPPDLSYGGSNFTPVFVSNNTFAESIHREVFATSTATTGSIGLSATLYIRPGQPFDTLTYSSSVAAIPEPSTFLLTGISLLALLALRRAGRRPVPAPSPYSVIPPQPR